MTDLPQNKTRERIMDAAEELFMKRGYSSVRLRDIAEAVDMRHASLYYYVPKGKDQLFAAVLRRSMERHELEMTRLINQVGDDIRAQAYAVSDWLVSQPPIDMVRMVQADLPKLEPAIAAEITDMMISSLTKPFIAAVERARDNEQVEIDNPMMAAMSLITLIQSVHHVPLEEIPEGRQLFGRKLTDLLLFGLLKR